MTKALLLALLLTFTIPIYAAEDRQPKTVRGKVVLPSGEVAENAEVVITCKGNVLTDTTSRFGNYEVTFGDFECEQFDTVTVTAELDGLVATITKEAQYFNGVNMDNIVLQATPVAVPEFGMLSAIIAGSSSLALYAGMKRTL